MGRGANLAYNREIWQTLGNRAQVHSEAATQSTPVPTDRGGHIGKLSATDKEGGGACGPLPQPERLLELLDGGKGGGRKTGVTSPAFAGEKYLGGGGLGGFIAS